MKLVIILSFTALITSASAQNFHAPRYESQHYFSFGLGSSGYYGDLQQQLLIPNAAFTAEISHRLSSQVHLRESLSYFRLGATDADQKSEDLISRNLSFYSSNLELAVTIEVHFAEIYSFKRRPIFNPFIFGGLGLVTVGPRAQMGGERYGLRKLRTEGQSYSPIAYTWPLGFGARIYLTPKVTLIAEFGYRATSTDYLDDVSTEYIKVLPTEGLRYLFADRSPELGLNNKESGMQRGNPNKNDGYAIMSFRLEWQLKDIF